MEGIKKRKKFYHDFSAEVQSKNGKCFVLGDFNGYVGSSAYG